MNGLQDAFGGFDKNKLMPEVRVFMAEELKHRQEATRLKDKIKRITKELEDVEILLKGAEENLKQAREKR